MKGSIKLARVAGIKVQIHWTFVFLILWIVLLELARGNGGTAILWSILFILTLFACVVMHELGHALTARRYNIQTRQITLLPIGGVASLESMPEDPREELMVAVAGPLVNIVIALVLYLLLPIEQFLSPEPEELAETLTAVNSGNFLFLLFSANLMLALFNVIPAFPMDGGRVLRALLSMRMNRVRATQIAARMGQATALLFFLLGLIYNPILALIGVFVFFGAQGENVMVQQLELLKNHTVREAMMTDITVLSPGTTLEEVVDIIIAGTERDFVVAEDSRVKGIVLQPSLIKAFRRHRQSIEVDEVMQVEVNTVTPDEQLTDLYARIRSGNEGFFPVLEDGKLIGAIDNQNINEFMIFRASLDY